METSVFSRVFIWDETLMETELRDTSERHDDFYSLYRAALIDGMPEGPSETERSKAHRHSTALMGCTIAGAIEKSQRMKIFDGQDESGREEPPRITLLVMLEELQLRRRDGDQCFF